MPYTIGFESYYKNGNKKGKVKTSFSQICDKGDLEKVKEEANDIWKKTDNEYFKEILIKDTKKKEIVFLHNNW